MLVSVTGADAGTSYRAVGLSGSSSKSLRRAHSSRYLVASFSAESRSLSCRFRLVPRTAIWLY